MEGRKNIPGKENSMCKGLCWKNRANPQAKIKSVSLLCKAQRKSVVGNEERQMGARQCRAV